VANGACERGDIRHRRDEDDVGWTVGDDVLLEECSEREEGAVHPPLPETGGMIDQGHLVS
jgi:hypothetical protein